MTNIATIIADFIDLLELLHVPGWVIPTRHKNLGVRWEKP